MKKGFSLIELVLAIVIVSIAILALPTIVIQSQRSNEMALQQELTLQAKAMIGRVLSSPWDSAHLNTRYNALRNDPAAGCAGVAMNAVLVQTADNPCRIELSTPIYNDTPAQRPGTNLVNTGVYRTTTRHVGAEAVIGGSSSISQFNYTNENSFGIAGSSFGVNAAGRNDIDDYGNNSQTGNYSMNVTPDNGDFLSSMTFSTRVVYNGNRFNDNRFSSRFPNGLNNSDVKEIQVTVSDAAGGVAARYSVSLLYFAPNIGDSRAAIQLW